MDATSPRASLTECDDQVGGLGQPLTFISWRARLSVFFLFAFVLAGCSTSTDKGQPAQSQASAPTVSEATEALESAATAEPDGSDTVTVILRNQGGAMEGHTPRGFRGMGTGLFVGDNLNPGFPNGDGVQLFLTFDLSEVPAGKVASAVLRSDNVEVQGTPFLDLGAVNAEELRYERFSSALWDSAPLPRGATCVFATRVDGPFSCDLTGAVQRCLADAYPSAQFRLRSDRAGDGDGRADMVMFFISNSNTNQPGIFELEVTVTKP